MFWVSQFLVNAAPVLISVAFQSARITGADISYSSPSLLSTAQTQPPILVTFGLVITAAVLAALAFRRFSVFGGLWLALPGYVACSQPILDAVFVPSLFHARDWLALLCSTIPTDAEAQRMGGYQVKKETIDRPAPLPPGTLAWPFPEVSFSYKKAEIA